ncbi:MAG: hypothetical protein JSU09_02765 [Bacteroidetes bacterium]|nr:hypothetical protein [Bacteroidota bacterium]
MKINRRRLLTPIRWREVTPLFREERGALTKLARGRSTPSVKIAQNVFSSEERIAQTFDELTPSLMHPNSLARIYPSLPRREGCANEVGAG